MSDLRDPALRAFGPTTTETTRSESYKSVKKTRGRRHKQLLRALIGLPKGSARSASELSALFLSAGITYQTVNIRPRLTELATMDLLETFGSAVDPASGKAQARYRVKPNRWDEVYMEVWP